MSEHKGIRLNKYLAEAGICSRREADRLIDEKRVCINGKTAGMGIFVMPGDVVTLNGKKVGSKQDKHVVAFYKPVGVTCTEKDKYAKKTIMECIKYSVRLTYAGRLDQDSEGLILLTNDGELIDALMRGANRHEKEYIVKVNKEITDDFIKRMGGGVYLKELDKTTRPCTVEKIGKYTFKIILTQGMNRQIRRMCETFGYKVETLKRVRINQITLGKLKPGELRKIEGEELVRLYASVGMEQTK